MAKQLPRPKHLVYLDEVVVGEQTFVVGESVWISRWRKSPSSHNLLGQIVHNTRSDELYVNVFCEKRGYAQWHSFAPDRLIKRVAKKKRGSK